MRVAGTRWCIERAFEDAKQEMVLDEYEVPQPLAHLRIQGHPSLGHRLPQLQEHRAGLRRPFPDQPLQDGEQDPVQVGQGVLVEAAEVPFHGALHVHGTLLPVQPRRVQGRLVEGVVGTRAPAGPDP